MNLFSEKNASPCRGCEKRQVGCHSSCLDYIKWKRESHEKAEKIKEAKARENEPTIYERRHAQICRYCRMGKNCKL